MHNTSPLGGVSDIAADHHAVTSTVTAASLGLTTHSIRTLRRNGILDAPAPSVVVFRGAPRTWLQRLAVATTTGGNHAVASFRSAAAMHDLDGVKPGAIDVTVRNGGKVHVPGAVVHQSRRLDEVDITVIAGIRCTTLERTVIDLAHILGNRMLERVIDDYERRMPSLEPLRTAALRLRRPNQRGTKRVLAEIEYRTNRGVVRGSWFEKLIEECLASPRLPPLVRQYELIDSTGRLVGRFDFAFPSLRLAIEAHSRRFHTGEHREQADQRRDNRAALEGWDIRYLGWADRRRPDIVRRYVERLADRRATDLGLR